MRKLEYLAADALAQGCDTLVSIGGVQSNHTRQVAAVAARLGLKCVLVQEHWVEWPDVVYDKVGNILLSRIMGADVRIVDAGFDIAFRPSWEDALDSVEAVGGKPYPIPAGASDHPLGGLGFARWAQEVAEQERELGVFFDTIVVCSVTGSTQAGMIAGFALQDAGRSVLGIDGSATVEQTLRSDRAHRATNGRGDRRRSRAHDEIVLLDEWHAGTYGIPDAKTIEAIRLCARLEGMLTDPVYEGKSMAALIDLVRDGRIEPGSRVLYAHLGGQPALNAYAGVFTPGCGTMRMYGFGSSQLAEDLLRILVRDRAGDDHVVALLPLRRRRDLVLRGQLQRVDHAQHLVEVAAGRHRIDEDQLHLLVRTDDEDVAHGLVVGRRAVGRDRPRRRAPGASRTASRR